MSNMKPGEMAKRFGVTVKTLQRWDISGKLVAYRTPTNRRYYTEDQYLAITKQKPIGYRKTKDGYGGKQTLSGDSIHHNHQKYYCYNCGAILDRDENAVINILNYKE